MFLRNLLTPTVRSACFTRRSIYRISSLVAHKNTINVPVIPVTGVQLSRISRIHTGYFQQSPKLPTVGSKMASSDGDVEGAQVLVEALKKQGVKYMFGVVGIPVVEIAVYAQQAGIHYIGMRNEQSAAYAAQAIGYLTGTPGACLCVSGPGVLHAVAGLANAKVNAWPMILIGGASEQDQEGKGGFQEWDQVGSCRPYCKYSARPPSISSFHYHVAQAIKTSTAGRPGPVYLDFPGNLLRTSIPRTEIVEEVQYSQAYPPQSSPIAIKEAVSTLLTSEKPLVIIGKGAAQSKAEENVRKLIETTGLPFLPTPMGKGVVSDSHHQCVAACRTTALASADTVLLLGARTNWMLHFASPPRFQKNVKIIQVDICPEEQSTSVHSSGTLLGDINAVCSQLLQELAGKRLVKETSQWWKLLSTAKQDNTSGVQAIISSENEPPLGYYSVFDTIAKSLPNDCIIATEGANTMDIGRSFLNHTEPRRRLDAGTFGTMGVGLAFAVAAAVANKNTGQRIVCIEGDSAFGFSGMEVETMFRYKLPVILIIVNNNGIYGGVTEEMLDDIRSAGETTLTTPPTSLLPTAQYHKFAELFGGTGYHCTTLAEIREAIQKAIECTDKPTLINIAISPFAQRKSQKFDWLTRTESKL